MAELHNIAERLTEGADKGGYSLLEKGHFLNIVRDMNESLVVLSPDAAISFVNTATLELLGYGRNEITGMPVGKMIDDGNLEFFKALREIITKGPVRDFRLDYIARNGERIPVSVNGSALRDEAKKFLGVVIVARDMRPVLGLINELEAARDGLEDKVKERTSELEKAYCELTSTQTQLIQSEKMASIGQLAAGVAHEINNPVAFLLSNLGTVEGYLDALTRIIRAYEGALEGVGGEAARRVEEVEELKKSLDLGFILDDTKDVIRESKDGAERVKSIVADLKDFSRVDSAETVYADLNKGIESTINIAFNEFKYKAEIIKEFGDLPQVKCRAMELNQVFMNLLINAGHAIREKGVIRIKTSHENGFVTIEISDDGCGIPKENLSRIFEPFFTTKPVGRGTGLGLSISYGIIKRHKGEITVQSEPGRGTAFKITLPVKGNDA